MRGFYRLGLLLALLCAVASADDFQWQGALSPGQTLEVRGINGNIHVDLTSDTQATLTASMSAVNDPPSSVQIQAVPYDGGVVVCAVYPSADPSQPNTCNPPGQTNFTSVSPTADTRVDFTIVIPAGVGLKATATNGDIVVTSLTGPAQLQTNKGNIVVASSGPINAVNVNGSIVGTFISTALTGSSSFRTSLGNIDVNLLTGTNVTIHSAAFIGGIQTSLPLTMARSGAGESGDGVLGSGDANLTVLTIAGAIHLRQN